MLLGAAKMQALRCRPIPCSNGVRGITGRSAFPMGHAVERRVNPAQLRQRGLTTVLASAAGAASGSSSQPPPSNLGKLVTLGSLAVLAAGAAALAATGTPLSAVKEVLARSGFTAAFSLIFVSEIGDKTFFIAALLAMKFGRFLSLAGTMTALSAMTIISVGIGYAFKNVPEALQTSAPIGEYLSVALLFYFGLSTLWTAYKTAPQGSSSAASDELEEAKEEVDRVAGKDKAGPQGNLAVFLEVTSLIFFAEWGDRSMLATVALGAAQNPVGVALGAIGGHLVASVIAVAGGAVISKYISERAVSIIGGVLFLVFGAATVFGLM